MSVTKAKKAGQQISTPPPPSVLTVLLWKHHEFIKRITVEYMYIV